jgi:hypothetical protein
VPASKPKPAPEPLAYTVGDFARAMGICRASAYKLIKTGQLESVVIAGRRLIPRRAAERLLERAA